MEEQPIAIAFCDKPKGDDILEELVWDGELFWGTIYHVYNRTHLTTAQLTKRNNDRFESLLRRYFPFIPADIRVAICHFLHLHF